MGIEFDGYYFDYMAYLEGLEAAEQYAGAVADEAFWAQNSWANQDAPALPVISDDPTQHEFEPSGDDIDEWDPEDPTVNQMILAQAPDAPALPVISDDPKQYEFAVEEEEFEFDEQWIEEQALIDDYITKAQVAIEQGANVVEDIVDDVIEYFKNK